MASPKDVFDTFPRSIQEVLQDPSTGFYIPSYQRPYSWENSNVKTLFAGLTDGLRSLRTSNDALTFIGAFIFVKDTSYRTVLPLVRHDLPAAVLLVIDGQQRLTTIALLLLHIHDAVRLSLDAVRREHPDLTWLDRRAVELLENLKSLLVIQKPGVSGPHKYYPRIIKAFEDQWSTTAGDDTESARYKSPVANYVWEYVNAVLAKDDYGLGDKKAWSPSFENKGAEFQRLTRAAKEIADQLKRLKRPRRDKAAEDDDDPSTAIPELIDLASDPQLIERFFGSPASDSVLSAWTSASETSSLAELTRLVALGRYVQNRVGVTDVQVKKEDYAFDLFEALNSTGEPLTAYETFKPVVIRDEGLESFSKSPTSKWISEIDAYLDEKSDSSKRREDSHNLLIPFALFQSGYKLGKVLRSQRDWLRRSYEESGSETKDRRDFVRGLASVATFLKNIWNSKDSISLQKQLSSDGLSLEDVAIVSLCIRVLNSSRHHITVALLARAYDQLCTSKDGSDEKASAINNFVGIVKAVTAFFVFWRSTRPGTFGLDKVYRDLMDKPKGDLGPFKRLGGKIPTWESVSASLRDTLQNDGEIKDMEAFQQSGAQYCYYDPGASINVVRFILLAAAHDEIPDSVRPGLTTAGKQGSSPMMTLEQWESDLEIEHVAPQKPRDGDEWNSEIYSKGKLFNSLGNLHLLPKRENIVLSNNSWKAKLACYSILAEQDPAKSKLLVDAMGQQGISLAVPSIEFLQATKVLPHLSAIVSIQDADWDAPRIIERTRDLLAKAWCRLAPWLGF